MPTRSSTYKRIGPHHLAHMRAVADGLDVRACARRFLGIEDAEEANLAHSELTARLRVAARQAGEKHYRLIGLRIRDRQRLLNRLEPTLNSRPSLEDFVAARGLDGWSEAEQLEMYEAEYPPQTGSVAALDTLRRRESARQRVVDMLGRLERDGSVTFSPRPDDDVQAWFTDPMAERIARSGLLTLGALASRIRQGGTWFARIEAVGRTKAAQIAQQLEAILPGSTSRVRAFPRFAASSLGAQSGRSISEPIAPASATMAGEAERAPSCEEARTSGDRAQEDQTPTQNAPHAVTLFAASLVTTSPYPTSTPAPPRPSPPYLVSQSSAGDPVALRHEEGPSVPIGAHREDNIGSIRSDIQALTVWVEAAAGSAATRKSYEREGRRLLLWLQIERGGKSLIDFRLDDAQAYRAFLAYIPDTWISRAKVSPGSPEWTPFMGQLSPSSQRQAMTVVGAWFDWLVNAEYLRANPWRLIKKTGQSREVTASVLDTKALSDRATSDIDDFIASQPPTPAQQRALFVFRFLSRTGLRSAELLSATIGNIRIEEEGVFLQVIGKGAKARDVLLVDSAVSALEDYLGSRGIRGIEQSSPDTPLFASLEDLSSPVSYQTLYKTTRRWLSRGVMLSSLPEAEKTRLQRASAHWLRHTFGTKAVALGTPLDVVQQQLGHASINTTMSIYSRAPLARRANELRKAWRESGPDGPNQGR